MARPTGKKHEFTEEREEIVDKEIAKTTPGTEEETKKGRPIKNKNHTAEDRNTKKYKKWGTNIPYGNIDLGRVGEEDVMKKILNKAYRMQYFYKIIDKNRALRTFVANPAQVHFFKNRTKRNIILKSRQIGFTTFSVIDMLDDVLFTRNYEALLISYDQESALDLFDNKIMLAWRHFPLSHVYETDVERQNRLKVGFRENPDGSSLTYSSISVRTSGRSSTLSRVHISELGKIATHNPIKAKEILSGTIPAVPLDGRIDIESTAMSDSDMFSDMFWEAWNRPEGAPTRPTDYKAHFYNWQWDLEEIAKIKARDAQLPREFADYQAKHNERAKTNPLLKPISDIEITFWFYKWIELNRSWNDLFQNFPTTPEEAFTSSGSKLFDVKYIEKALDRVAQITPEHQVGAWTFIKNPNPSHEYAMGADPSEGVGRDSSAAVIIDFTPHIPEIVATYANDSIPPDLFAFELKSAALYYNTALVVVERNNHGFATLTKLKEIYPIDRIYKQEKLDYEEDDPRQGERLGWHTNLMSKPRMMYEVASAFHEGLLAVLSKQILHEMRLYNKDDLQYIRAKDLGTRHYDLLTAAAICFQMRHLVEYKHDRVEVVSPSRRQESNLYTAI